MLHFQANKAIFAQQAPTSLQKEGEGQIVRSATKTALVCLAFVMNFGIV